MYVYEGIEEGKFRICLYEGLYPDVSLDLDLYTYDEVKLILTLGIKISRLGIDDLGVFYFEEETVQQHVLRNPQSYFSLRNRMPGERLYEKRYITWLSCR